MDAAAITFIILGSLIGIVIIAIICYAIWDEVRFSKVKSQTIESQFIGRDIDTKTALKNTLSPNGSGGVNVGITSSQEVIYITEWDVDALGRITIEDEDLYRYTRDIDRKSVVKLQFKIIDKQNYRYEGIVE